MNGDKSDYLRLRFDLKLNEFLLTCVGAHIMKCFKMPNLNTHGKIKQRIKVVPRLLITKFSIHQNDATTKTIVVCT